MDSPRRLYRSRTNRFVGGVCGGAAEYFDIDITLVRVIWVLFTLLGGAGLLMYILGLVIIPENPEKSPPREGTNISKSDAGLFWGIVLIVLGAYFLMREFGMWRVSDWWWDYEHIWQGVGSNYWPVILIIGGLVYIFHSMRSREGVDEMADASTKEERKRWKRSKTERMIGGVCGGLSELWDIDPTFVRLGYALLTILTGFFWGIAAYVILLIVMPEDEAATDSKVEEKARAAEKPAPAEAAATPPERKKAAPPKKKTSTTRARKTSTRPRKPRKPSGPAAEGEAAAE